MITWFIETITNHSPVLSGGVSAPRLPINMQWGTGAALNIEWGAGSNLNCEW